MNYEDIGLNERLMSLNSIFALDKKAPETSEEDFQRGTFDIFNVQKDMLFVKGPKSATEVADTGSSWADPTNALIADGNYAIATAPGAQYFTSELHFSKFNFNIPLEAKILGIKAEIIQLNNGPTGTRAQLLKNGNLVGNIRFKGHTDNPAAIKNMLYGSGTDTWGTTWTSTEVNDSDFGVSFHSFLILPGVQMKVDSISVYVYYTL